MNPPSTLNSIVNTYHKVFAMNESHTTLAEKEIGSNIVSSERLSFTSKGGLGYQKGAFSFRTGKWLGTSKRKINLKNSNFDFS